MASHTFDFTDVLIAHDALRAQPDEIAWRERLAARAERGPAPPCPASLLAERGDRRFESMLTGLAAFLDPPDMPGLVALGATDALVAAMAAPWAPTPLRAAAADGLAHSAPNAVALGALAETAEHTKGAPRPNVLAAHDAMYARADDATRSAADKFRARAKLSRTWTGVRRQELQREVATGALHPVAGLLSGDAAFLSALVPPISDSARALLVPFLLANAREGTDEARTRTMALFHGRWREVAREPLSALARFVKLRGRDSALPVLAVAALASMGAIRDLLFAAVSGASETRVVALAALERAGARSVTEADRGLFHEAADHLEAHGEAEPARRLRALSGAAAG